MLDISFHRYDLGFQKPSACRSNRPRIAARGIDVRYVPFEFIADLHQLQCVAKVGVCVAAAPAYVLTSKLVESVHMIVASRRASPITMLASSVLARSALTTFSSTESCAMRSR